MGKPPIKQKYITEDELFNLWNDYKTEVDSKPDKQQIATGKGVFEIAVKRPYQRQGFEAFVYRKLKCHVHQYIDNDGDRYDSYVGVVTHMRNEWQEDQIDGTLTGRYKSPNLVARLNGISDNKQMNVTMEQPLFNVSSNNSNKQGSKP